MKAQEELGISADLVPLAIIFVTWVTCWSLVALVFTAVALKATRKLLREADANGLPGNDWPRLAILRPCAGLDPELEANLLSTLTARYDGARELYILVASEADAAHAVAERVRERGLTLAAHVPVRVVITDIRTKYNRKVAQLGCAQDLSTAPVVVVVDSDLQLQDATLPSLVAALMADPKAGAASCPPVDMRTDTLGDRASSALLSSTPHAFYCLAALAERSRGAHVLCGALIAVHRRVLDELGGFVALERYLGEDFELARLLHERGYTIPTAAAPGQVTDHGRTLRSVIQRFARWATVTRQQRPHLMITYPLLIACSPLLLLSAGLLGNAPYAWVPTIIVAAFLAVRTALAMRLRRAYGLPAGILRSLLAMLLGECLILVSAAGALGRPVVRWRGQRYRIGRGGFIELLSDEA